MRYTQEVWMVRKQKRFLAFGDLHFGWTKRISPRGTQRKTPIHVEAAFNSMMAFAHDYKPDIVLLMGDLFDMTPVCRHEIDTPGKMEGQRLIEVYEKGREFFINPILELGAETHWFDGNHEAWAYQLTNKFPGISGMLDPYHWLRLDNDDIIFHPQGDIYHPAKGKLAVTHGDGLVRSGKYAASRAVERYGSSIRLWHFHTWQVFIKETMKNNAYQSGVVVPCMCTRTPSYRPTDLNSSVHGFDFGVIEANGSFDDAVAIIWNGQTTINGKVYG
jgi:hypothetical protein